jgi:endonuclease/exonuclease/phosphatase family metal-dependent hydrolase
MPKESMQRPRVHAAERRLPLLLVAIPAAAAGCASMPADRVQSCATKRPQIEIDAPSGRSSTTLSVLIYNVEGLPWPARRNRTPQLREITRQLGWLRRRGLAPDIVLLQEAFTFEAASIGRRVGYPNYVGGPQARDKAPRSSPRTPADFVRQRSFWKGERFPKQLSGGIYLLSDYPVTALYKRPFKRYECAGYDCLANKGVMLARISIPGVPTPIDIFNTHMNSQGSSGVPRSRSLAAHRLQTDESADFIQATRERRNAFIFGGDFNMRGSLARFSHFRFRKPYDIVRHYCSVVVADCDIRMSWDGDAPWLDTQDLQGFDDGEVVKVRPIRVEAMFDAPWNGRPLADHDGYLVSYRLTWPSLARLEGQVPSCSSSSVSPDQS